MHKAFVHGDRLDHDGYPPGCPFNTSRAGRTLATIRSMGLMDGEDRQVVAPEPLSIADLEKFHSPKYVDALRRAGSGDLTPEEALHFGLGTPDCPIFRNMLDYIALAAGASVTGARLLLDGKADFAFNPSGGFHHAQPGNASGFCYVNDVVLAIKTLADAGRRVAFLDIDVHHSDGVQEAFYRRKDVLTISMHESGKTLYPGTGFETEIGAGEGLGYSVNIPFPVSTYDAAYWKAFRSVVRPILQAFDPDVIVLEIGMDGLAGDPLAHLQLTNNVYADVVEAVRKLGKPILATGGGGYNVHSTVRGWALMWSVLCGDREHDASFGMGGVMMENTDWLGGLRDRALISDAGLRGVVDAEVDRLIAKLKETVFPIHGID